jgi:hypothetical protein
MIAKHEVRMICTPLQTTANCNSALATLLTDCIRVDFIGHRPFVRSAQLSGTLVAVVAMTTATDPRR